MNTKLNTLAEPWYRHRWPWLLMAGPAIVVVAGVITTYLAVVTSDGLVTDDYYKQGLAVNQSIARDQVAVDRGLEAELVIGGDEMLVRVFLRASQEMTMPESIRLRIAHPTRDGLDQNIELRADGAGFYTGRLSAPFTGRWLVTLEDTKREDWRLSGEWVREVQSALRLSAVAKAGGSTIHFDNKGR